MTTGLDFTRNFIRWTTDIFVVVYGLWTILCHVMVRAKLGFSSLARFSFLVPLSAVLVLVLLALSRRGSRDDPGPPPRELPTASSNVPRLIGLAGAAALALFYALSRSYLVFWAASVLFLGFFYLKHVRPTNFAPARLDMRRGEPAVFFVLLLTAIILVMVLHRPDQDDSYYLSYSVEALESPETPLLRAYPGTEHYLRETIPVHSVHSVELAFAMTARLLGTRPITASHVILPLIFAMVFICGAARLFRILLGRSWLYGLAALVFILLADGGIHWSYGNFSLVRFFQGKAMLATGMVPLLAAYSLEYMSRQGRAVWPLLFLAQVAGLGLSSAGLYVGPVVAGLSLLAAWSPGWRSAERLILGGLSAAYPLAVGIFLRFGPIAVAPGFLEAGRRVPAVPELLDKVFGPGVFFWIWLFTLLGGWAVMGDVSRRRWVLGYALAYLLLFLNPFLIVFWARNLLGVETMWRVLWALPLPVWLAAVLAELSGAAALGMKRPKLRAAVLGALLVLFGLVVPARWTVSRDNRTEIRWPSLKVPPGDFRLAEQTVSLTDPGGVILAPEAVSVWVPTITNNVGVLASREFTLVIVRTRSTSADVRQDLSLRLALLHYVSGTYREPSRDRSRKMFLEGITRYGIRTVVLTRLNPWKSDIETALRQAGFRKTAISSRKYLLYNRSDDRPGRRYVP